MHATTTYHFRRFHAFFSMNMDSIDPELGVLESEQLPLSDDTNIAPKLHRTTLARRANGKVVPRDQYRENCSLLTKDQEIFLLKYIDKLTMRGLPPTPHNIRVFASNLCGKLPSKNWTSRFVHRHREHLCSEFLVGFDLCRKKADNWLMINRYFKLVEEKWKEHKYEPKNVYNVDEKGFLIGVLHKTRRIFSRSWKEQGKLKGAIQDGNRTWITLLACVCADGTSLPPALIYPSESGEVLDVWLDDYEPADGGYFAASPTGWTNNELAMEWLAKLFDRHTKQKARKGRDPRLLVLDGHISHINLEFLSWCEAHNIHVLAFPPHTTHRLQPLDVSLFSPLATYYSQELDRWLQATQALSGMNKLKFYSLFKPAFEKAFSESNIASGWRKTGLHPFDPSVVLNQLSTRPEPPETRPGSGNSSDKSVLSISDWRKVRAMLKDVVGEALHYEGRELLKVYSELQAKNAFLKEENNGLKGAVVDEKKKKKPRKRVVDELRRPENGNATLFSPKKVSRARELKEQRERTAEEAKAQKEQQRLEKRLLREEQEAKRKAAAEVRLERREQAASEKAEKQRQREEALAQRLASLQLANEQKAEGANPKRKPRKDQHHAASGCDQISHMEEPEASEAVMPVTRSGRQLRKPQRLEGFEL